LVTAELHNKDGKQNDLQNPKKNIKKYWLKMLVETRRFTILILRLLQNLGITVGP